MTCDHSTSSAVSRPQPPGRVGRRQGAAARLVHPGQIDRGQPIIGVECRHVRREGGFVVGVDDGDRLPGAVARDRAKRGEIDAVGRANGRGAVASRAARGLIRLGLPAWWWITNVVWATSAAVGLGPSNAGIEAIGLMDIKSRGSIDSNRHVRLLVGRFSAVRLIAELERRRDPLSTARGAASQVENVAENGHGHITFLCVTPGSIILRHWIPRWRLKARTSTRPQHNKGESQHATEPLFALNEGNVKFPSNSC